MPNEFVAPTLNVNAFTCPHCEVFAEQLWHHVVIQSPVTGVNAEPRLQVCRCRRCSEISLWVDGRMVQPDASPAPIPNEDLSEEIRRDYEEARTILAKSPRGAAALLRLCIQKLCQELGEPGKNINDDIAHLVKNGLPAKIQQALDIVRVAGNNAVHPGQLDISDDAATAMQLFSLVNVIADVMISQPKHIETLYQGLPATAREAIEQRDAPPLA